MKNTEIFDQDLNPVLEMASDTDLETLVEYISDKFSENLTQHEAYKLNAPEHSRYADLIAKEIRDMGGNSFANVYRGEGPAYHEIVCDVAKQLKAPYNKNQSVENIENPILETILSKALDKMTDAEKEELGAQLGEKASLGKGGITTAAVITLFRAGGFMSYQLTVIIANHIARALLGHGLSLATNNALMRTASILAGPIGWAISGIWTAVDLAGPAYKVTIPSVIHISMLRKKLNSIECNKCQTFIPENSAKFCPECGTPMTA